TISSSPTVTSSSTVSRMIGNVTSPGRFTAMPSAIVSTRSTGSMRPARTLDTIGAEPAAAARHHRHVEVGHLRVELQAERALAGDHQVVVERGHERGAGALGQLP